MPGKEFNNADYRVANTYLAKKIATEAEGLFKPEFIDGTDRAPNIDMLAGDLYKLAGGELRDIGDIVALVITDNIEERKALEEDRNKALNVWCEKWLSEAAKKRLFSRVASARNARNKSLKTANIDSDIYTRILQAKKHSKSANLDAVLTRLLDDYEKSNNVELWRIRLEKQAQND